MRSALKVGGFGVVVIVLEDKSEFVHEVRLFGGDSSRFEVRCEDHESGLCIN